MSTDLDAQVTLSTPTGTLQLDQPGAYTLVKVGVTPRKWRRHTVEGRYQHGRALLGAVLEQATLTVQIRCEGTTWIAASNRLTTLVEAVSQFTYTATVNLAGQIDTYTCEPADMALASGETLEELAVMAAQQDYVLTIPVRPL